jgi:hypothetical protein
MHLMIRRSLLAVAAVVLVAWQMGASRGLAAGEKARQRSSTAVAESEPTAISVSELAQLQKGKNDLFVYDVNGDKLYFAACSMTTSNPPPFRKIKRQRWFSIAWTAARRAAISRATP